MKGRSLGAALLALLLLRVASANAQPALWISAPGCEQSAAIGAIHGSLLLIGASVACEFDPVNVSLVRTIPLPAPATLQTRVAEAPGDDFLVARPNVVYQIDGPTGAIVQSFTNPDPQPFDGYGSAFAAVGSHVVVSAPNSAVVHVFDAATGALQHSIPSPGDISFGEGLAELGGEIVTSGFSQTLPREIRVRRYDADTGASLGFLATAPGNAGLDAPLAVVGGDVLLGAPEYSPVLGALYLFDGATGTLIRTFTPPDEREAEWLGIVLATTSDTVAAGTLSGSVYLFDLATGAHLRTIRNPAHSFDSSPEQLALIADRTVVGPYVYAVCGGTVGCGPCETCGPSGSCVVAPHPTCQQMEPSGAFRLNLRDAPGPGGERVTWKGKGELAPGGPPIGGSGSVWDDPLNDTDYAVCLWNPAPVFQARIPAGGTCGSRDCWRPLGRLSNRTGFAYKDPDRTPDGIGALRLQERGALLTVKLNGMGANLVGRPFGLPSPPLSLPLQLQLQARDGQCFEATYSTAIANNDAAFLGRSD